MWIAQNPDFILKRHSSPFNILLAYGLLFYRYLKTPTGTPQKRSSTSLGKLQLN